MVRDYIQYTALAATNTFIVEMLTKPRVFKMQCTFHLSLLNNLQSISPSVLSPAELALLLAAPHIRTWLHTPHLASNGKSCQ